MRTILPLILLLGCGSPPAEDTAIPEPAAPRDLDLDGFVSALDGGDDCDDYDPDVNPGVVETCNGIDDDCDTEVDEGLRIVYAADADGDGYGDPDGAVEGCSVPVGHTEVLGDCDDASDAVHPEAQEVCNGVDDDCDEAVDDDALDALVYYLDDDGDGFGLEGVTTAACALPVGYAEVAGDCDDGSDQIWPGAPESCDAPDVDANCDGFAGLADADGDGFAACEECDDGDDLVSPGALEVCNGVDDDCDGSVDDGLDPDGDGFTVCGGDCDEGDPLAYPGAEEVPYDGVDQDCDGADLVDVDGDGFAAEAAGGDDCDDDDPDISPGETFDDWDGVDDDCDGLLDDGPFTATYEVDVMAIWGNHCLGGCHGGATPQDGLDLRSPSYDVLVGAASFDVPAMPRVTPFSLDDSYLWHKLVDTHLTVGGAGVSMPKDEPLLTAAELDVVSAWILEGAPP